MQGVKMQARELVEKVDAFIAQLNLLPGDRVPTEDELMEKFEITRYRARTVLDNLLHKYGWVKLHGSGTYLPGGAATPKIKEKTVALIGPDGKVDMKPLHELAISKNYHLLNFWISHQNSSFERLCLESVTKRLLASVCLEPIPLRPLNFDLVDKLVEEGVKVLLMNAPNELRDKYSIFLLNYHKAGFMAGAYMAKKGLKNVYFIRSNSMAWQNQDFSDGVYRAAKKHSLNITLLHGDVKSATNTDESDLVWTDDSNPIPLKEGSGYLADNYYKGVMLYKQLQESGIANPDVFGVSTLRKSAPFPFAFLDPTLRLTEMLTVALDNSIAANINCSKLYNPIMVPPNSKVNI
jgi:hypothetical protein